MKVIIIKDVQNLGNVGDIKDVSNGYARNFLIPGGYVEIATKRAIEQIKKAQIGKKKQMEEELKTVEELASKLESISITIKTKADKSGKFYAAVKPEEISEGLAKKGFNIEKDKIIIKEPIKKAGEYEIMIVFGHGIESRFNLIVESEK